ncbi:POK6 protein, partial [Ardeotis kori]|nr:POK6 protein [Ardeotis kori]
ESSTQIVDLAAVVRALYKWKDEFLSIVSDSAYVVNVIQREERAMLREINNSLLYDQFQQLLSVLRVRDHPYFIVHLRAHTSLPGPVTEGNRRADALTNAALVANTLMQAKLSHEFYHQNSTVLQRQFKLAQEQARAIVRSCSSCQNAIMPPLYGVDLRGLRSQELWQSDITHVPSFGRHKYVHITTDTHSSLLFASAHTGERAQDVCQHWTSAFAFMGIPTRIKTDNGPAYASRAVQTFLALWGVKHHVTDILHNPTGQAIIERAHGTLKNILLKQ